MTPWFASHLQKFCDHLAHTKRASAHTVAAYGRDLKQIAAFLEKHLGEPLSPHTWQHLTVADAQAFLADLRLNQKQSPASMNRKLSSLRAFNSWLAEHHGVANNQLTTLKSLKTPPPTPKAIRKESVFDMLGEMMPREVNARDLPWPQRRDFTLFMCLYGLGLRISEALSLTRTDVVGETLRVLGKGQKERLLPLPLAVQSALNSWLNCTLTNNQGEPLTIVPSAPLFPSSQQKNGVWQALTPRSAQRQLKALREKLGLGDYVTPHALRHSFATHLLHNGADLRTVQDLLGHANLSTTQRYLAGDLKRLREVHHTAHPLENGRFEEGKIPEPF